MNFWCILGSFLLDVQSIEFDDYDKLRDAHIWPMFNILPWYWCQPPN